MYENDSLFLSSSARVLESSYNVELVLKYLITSSEVPVPIINKKHHWYRLDTTKPRIAGFEALWVFTKPTCPPLLRGEWWVNVKNGTACCL